ncbi:hypothetical protein OIU76_001857 [Salix suchowensis]|nr:hypothetical protein OIU76_001857 [Salix suchowensis]
MKQPDPRRHPPPPSHQIIAKTTSNTTTPPLLQKTPKLSIPTNKLGPSQPDPVRTLTPAHIPHRPNLPLDTNRSPPIHRHSRSPTPNLPQAPSKWRRLLPNPPFPSQSAAKVGSPQFSQHQHLTDRNVARVRRR